MKREFNVNEYMGTIIVSIVLLTAGFLYPMLTNELLNDILWNGEEFEIYLFIAAGIAIFGIAGLFINKLVAAYTGSKKIIWFTPKQHQTASNLFVGFGMSYNFLMVYNEIKSYGIMGKYALKESGFSFFGPIAIIGIVVSAIGLVYASFCVFNKPAQTSVKLCTNCGKSLTSDSSFCDNCGTPVGTVVKNVVESKPKPAVEHKSEVPDESGTQNPQNPISDNGKFKPAGDL